MEPISYFIERRRLPIATIYEIAKLLHTSPATVSRALSGTGYVRRELREQVIQLAKEMDYQPNTLARSLTKKESNTIGFILTDIMNPLLTAFAQNIERNLTDEGYAMILMTTEHNPLKEARALDVLRSKQVDGIIMYSVSDYNQEKINTIRQSECPIVLLTEEITTCDVVSIDNQLGAYKAVSYLAGLGHQRIAFINGGGILGSKRKLTGYLNALDEYGCPYDPDLITIPKEINYEHGFYAAERFLSQAHPPTAIFASSDYLALGAMSWCLKQGLAIPRDVSLVGFDDIEAVKYSPVPLTSVNYQIERIAQSALERLFELIARGDKRLDSIEAIQTFIEPDLVIRQSAASAINPEL